MTKKYARYAKLTILFLLIFSVVFSWFCWNDKCSISYEENSAVNPYFRVIVFDADSYHAVPYADLTKYIKEHPRASVWLESDFGLSDDQYWEFNITDRDKNFQRIEVSFLDDGSIDEVYDVRDGKVVPVSFRMINPFHVLIALMISLLLTIWAYFLFKKIIRN